MLTRRNIRFGPFELDLGARQLKRDGASVKLRPTPFAVLTYLAQRPGQPVTKDELIEAVWPNRVISESTLTTAIGEVRQALDEGENPHPYVETLRGRGFVFSAGDLLSTLQEVAPPFPAYDGAERYVFVCYAHDDRKLVYPELVVLDDLGFNIWYDEGIAPATEWTEEIANAINGCDVFLYYISKNGVQSTNCQNEVQFAASRNKRIVSAYLEDIQVSDSLELTLGRLQAIHRFTDKSRFREKVVSALSGESTPKTHPPALPEENNGRR